MFKDGRVYAQNRFVTTDLWDPDAPEGEGAAGAVRAWTPRPGGWLKNAFKIPGNPANTNVMVKGGKLYALCEGGRPVEMDPVTLATRGESDLGGIKVRGYSSTNRQHFSSNLLEKCSQTLPLRPQPSCKLCIPSAGAHFSRCFSGWCASAFSHFSNHRPATV